MAELLVLQGGGTLVKTDQDGKQLPLNDGEFWLWLTLVLGFYLLTTNDFYAFVVLNIIYVSKCISCCESVEKGYHGWRVKNLLLFCLVSDL